MPHIKDFSAKKDEPCVTFGLLTDIQHANIEDGINYVNRRYYRNSLNLIREATEKWIQMPNFKFIIQLGDLIDGKSKIINDSTPAINRVLNELNKAFENDMAPFNEASNKIERTPKLLHIWGNHEFYNFKRDELVLTELNTAKYLNPSIQSKGNYYTFNVNEKLKLICLDFYDFSCLGYDESSEDYKKAFDYLRTHNENFDLDLVDGLTGNDTRFSLMNGAISSQQLNWFKNELQICKNNNQKVIICGHLPIHEKSCDSSCLSWDYKELLDIVWSFEKTIIAYFAGHNHAGGYYYDGTLHHFTFPAILETPPNKNSFTTVKVYEDKVLVECMGSSIGNHKIYF